MKPENLNPKMAAEHRRFRAAYDAKIAAIDGVWKREGSQCEVCRKGLQRPGHAQYMENVGCVTFDAQPPTLDSGHLRCGVCQKKAMARVRP